MPPSPGRTNAPGPPLTPRVEAATPPGSETMSRRRTSACLSVVLLEQSQDSEILIRMAAESEWNNTRILMDRPSTVRLVGVVVLVAPASVSELPPAPAVRGRRTGLGPCHLLLAAYASRPRDHAGRRPRPAVSRWSLWAERRRSWVRLVGRIIWNRRKGGDGKLRLRVPAKRGSFEVSRWNHLGS